MKKQVKIALLAALFCVLVAASGLIGYYFATDGAMPPRAGDKPVQEVEKTPSFPNKGAYEKMEAPVYNEYALVYSDTGNLLGNLLAGGLVAPTRSMVFQSIPEVGIYKFSQSTEESSFFSLPSETGGAQDYRSLNRINGKMIYVDNGNHTLYAVDSDGGNRVRLAAGVTLCFVYGQTAYYTTQTGVYMVPVSGGTPTALFEQKNSTFTLVGLSNTRIYFSVERSEKVEWLSVSLKHPAEDVQRFLEPTRGRELFSAQYSDGWLYYLKGKTNGSDLYRRQIGDASEQLLAEDVSQYVVDKNCVYFGGSSGAAYQVEELNTNSGARKTVLIVSAAGGGDLVCYAAGEYIYAIGTDSRGNQVNCRTCLWTAANDLMHYDAASGTWTLQKP